MAKRKKSFTDKNKKYLAPAIIVVVLILMFSFFLNTNKNTNTLDVLEIDIFTLDPIDGREISFKGVKVGMSKQEAIDILGFPDKEYFPTKNPDVKNLEFARAVNTEETGIIMQAVDEVITKITLKPALNDQLQGKTKIINKKDDILLALRAPEKAEVVPIKEGSAKGMTLITYTEMHLQFGFYRGQQVSMSFIL